MSFSVSYRQGSSLGYAWFTAVRPALRYAGLAGAAGLTVALVLASASDWPAAAALLHSLGTIHALLGASLAAVLLYAALSAVAAIAGGLLALAELAPQLALGGMLMSAMPAEQASEPEPEPAAASGAKSVAHPEMQVGLYLGKTLSPPSDVFMKAPDGTDLTLKDLKWKPESFKPSPFYGGRGIDWSSRAPRFGAMLDFTHAKATAIRSQTVSLTGRHKGEDVPPRAPFESIFRKLEFTHGLNFLTLNGVYRATGLRRRIVPYAGLGIGLMVPHAEAWRAGEPKEESVHDAQLTGMAFQVFGGIEWRVFKSDRRSLFTEYKFTYTTNDVTLKDGGLVTANILVHQFIFGGYTTPWRLGGAAAR